MQMEGTMKHSISPDNRVYRFRPIFRLLGTEEKPGELEGGYIFFPTPEQLNDPFEGYTKFHWAGDRIVWENLFKHFVCCIAHDVFLRTLGSQQEELPQARTRLSSKLREIVDEACAAVLKNERIQEHIGALAHDQRKVTKDELTVQMIAVQTFVTDRVLSCFARHGIVKDYESKDTEPDMFSDGLMAAQRWGIADGIPEDELEKIYLRLNLRFQRIALTLDIVNRRSKADQLGNFYASHFVSELNKLTQSPWYVACFMSNCENSAIWGSYGSNHQGACLIFDTVENDEGHRCLMLDYPAQGAGGNLETRKWRAALQKVRYTDEAVQLNFFESFAAYTHSELLENWLTDGAGNSSPLVGSYGSDRSRTAYWESVNRRLTTKWDAWKNENEYRILYNPMMSDVSDPSMRIMRYDFSALRGIVFGTKTPMEDITKIIDKVVELCERSGRETFEFYRAFHNTHINKLEILPLGTLAEITTGTYPFESLSK